MVSIGYALSAEEHGPNELVRNGRLSEDAGFEFAVVSDHYHPWIDRRDVSDHPDPPRGPSRRLRRLPRR